MQDDEGTVVRRVDPLASEERALSTWIDLVGCVRIVWAGALMRRAAVASLAALALAGCGKSNIVAVKRPILPMVVCSFPSEEPEERCARPFDVGQLIGQRLPAAEKLARTHHYEVRRIAPLAKGEALTEDLDPSRLNVECDSTSPNCIVVRYVKRG